MTLPDDTATAVADGQATAAVPAVGDTQGAVVTPPPGQTDTTQGQAVDSVVTEELQPPDDLKESWNSLPPEQRKIVNKAYTQARQRDAQKLKEHPGQKLIDAFNSDPVGTYRAIEAQLKAQGALKDGDTPKQPLTQPTEAIIGRLTETYGSEATQLLREAIKAEIAQEVGPLKQWAGQTAAETTHAQAQALKAGFEAKNPGALAKYGDKMAELGHKLTEGGRIPTTVPPDEWLSILHKVAAFDDLIGAEAQKLVTRMQQSAATAEKPANAVPSSRVAKKAPSLEDFNGNVDAAMKAAGEAALRGDLWER